MNTTFAPKSFTIVTINRNKEVVKTVNVEGWVNALNKLDVYYKNTREAGYNVEAKGTWDAPTYIIRKCTNLNSTITSFSARKWNTCKEDSEYYFIYIKKVA